MTDGKGAWLNSKTFTKQFKLNTVNLDNTNHQNARIEKVSGAIVKKQGGVVNVRMKVSGLENVELVGDITGLHESDGYLTLQVRLTTPVGWHAKASLTHKDLFMLIKLLLFKPANLRYMFFGFGKPDSLDTGTSANQ